MGRGEYDFSNVKAESASGKSGGKTHLVEKRGTEGMMQLMPKQKRDEAPKQKGKKGPIDQVIDYDYDEVPEGEGTPERKPNREQRLREAE